jgi:hypothetical protein
MSSDLRAVLGAMLVLAVALAAAVVFIGSLAVLAGRYMGGN